MSEIEPRFSGVTLINTFTVREGQQDGLIRLPGEATGTVMRQQTGFASANFDARLDGKHVINYALWKSRKDFEAMHAILPCRSI